MSDIMRQLHLDHVNMARLLNILDQQITMLEGEGDPDYGLMVDIMHYMTTYPDQYHHPKEDLVFAKLMVRDSGTGPTVEALESEHKTIIQKGAQFLASVRGVENDAIMRRDRLAAEGADYVASLRNHMNKEEAQVFPQAEKMLRAEDWVEVDMKMQPRQDPLFGKFREEQYRKRYEQIMRLLEAGADDEE